MANWIWTASESIWHQRTYNASFGDTENQNVIFAEFKKDYKLKGKALFAEIRVSADTFFKLYNRGETVGMGPVCSGGDFLNNGSAPVHYENSYILDKPGDLLEFYALVRMGKDVSTDYSRGHGGFFLECHVVYADGTDELFGTDGTWLARENGKYVSNTVYDERVEERQWQNAVLTPDIWNTKPAEIPMLEITHIAPCENAEYVLSPEETVNYICNFDKIRAGYITVEVTAPDGCSVTADIFEVPEECHQKECMTFTGTGKHTGFRLESVGGIKIRAVNFSKTLGATVRISLVAVRYPVIREGCFRCDDEEINKVFDVCKHTLSICRQTIHLDSPKHQEPLACTGDYYIESLMEAFAFGDMRLAEFDIKRTADWLSANDGRMFHTTYSLIWVQMLKDVYMFTGNRGLLEYCRNASGLLFERFNGYIGDSGILEHMPDLMFVDWIVVDGYSMHHPPKYLGQTVLCAFYHGALLAGAEIADMLDDSDTARTYTERAARLKKAMFEQLYDEKEGLFTAGLGTPSDKVKYFYPENVNRSRILAHGNILAVLYGLFDLTQSRRVMERVMLDRTLPDYQPYFAHFVFEALRVAGLYDKYAPTLLRRWIPMVQKCDKGLQEGWIKPEEGYRFDYSHAWGGTPVYQLMRSCLGFEITEPGLKQFKTDINLLGFNSIEIKMPLPQGLLCVRAEKGKEPDIIITAE